MDDTLLESITQNPASCEFQHSCIVGSNSCDQSATTWCPDYNKHKQARKDLCPQMTNKDFPEDLSRCNIPAIKALLPPELNCNKSGECIKSVFPELKTFLAPFHEDPEMGISAKFTLNDLHAIKKLIEQLQRKKITQRQSNSELPTKSLAHAA